MDADPRDPRVNILIADDEPLVRDALAAFLSDKHNCTVAGSAEEALECIRTQKYEVVLTDIKMGGMSGLTLASMIHDLDPEQVVIVISGGYVIQTAIDAIRAKAFDYLLKPFSLQQLEQSVARAIDHHKLIVSRREHETVLKDLVDKRTCELEKAIAAVKSAYSATLTALVTALETRATECVGHSERVVKYSLRLGREMGLDENELRALEFGAVLHDIGKIGVPDSILGKPGGLTEAELNQTKMHPQRGRDIVKNVPFLSGAALVIGQHHEKWDGSGFPCGLSGEEIDIKARIFTVIDAFEAMTTDKAKRRAMTIEEAVCELDRCAGTQFDPGVIAAFHRIPHSHWSEIETTSDRLQP